MKHEASYKQLAKMVLFLNEKIKKLEEQNNTQIESIKYWQDVTIQQNKQINQQNIQYEELLYQSKKDKIIKKENPNLETQVTDLEIKNKNLDELLNSYENSYDKIKKENKKLKKCINQLDDKIDKLHFELNKEKCNSNLFLSELTEYNKNKHCIENQIKNKRKPIKEEKDLSEINKEDLSEINKEDLSEINKEDLSEINIPQGTIVKSITKTIKVKLDKLGNYAPTK